MIWPISTLVSMIWLLGCHNLMTIYCLSHIHLGSLGMLPLSVRNNMISLDQCRLWRLSGGGGVFSCYIGPIKQGATRNVAIRRHLPPETKACQHLIADDAILRGVWLLIMSGVTATQHTSAWITGELRVMEDSVTAVVKIKVDSNVFM